MLSGVYQIKWFHMNHLISLLKVGVITVQKPDRPRLDRTEDRVREKP